MKKSVDEYHIVHGFYSYIKEYYGVYCSRISMVS